MGFGEICDRFVHFGSRWPLLPEGLIPQCKDCCSTCGAYAFQPLTILEVQSVQPSDLFDYSWSSFRQRRHRQCNEGAQESTRLISQHILSFANTLHHSVRRRSLRSIRQRTEEKTKDEEIGRLSSLTFTLDID
uniref:ShKT domain-containing protein n=1 Tax=Panagrellus redivivus TaxID=6233 RepID=A0A7E4VRS4_PANRE